MASVCNYYTSKYILVQRHYWPLKGPLEHEINNSPWSCYKGNGPRIIWAPHEEHFNSFLIRPQFCNSFNNVSLSWQINKIFHKFILDNSIFRPNHILVMYSKWRMKRWQDWIHTNKPAASHYYTWFFSTWIFQIIISQHTIFPDIILITMTY